MDDQWEAMNKRLMQIEEETRVKVESLNQELAERDNIIQQLNAQIEEMMLQQAGQAPADFTQERERYEEEISNLNGKIIALQKQLKSSSGSAEQIIALQEQVGVFQEINKQIDVEKRALEDELQSEQNQLIVLQDLNKQLETEKSKLETELQELKERKPKEKTDEGSEFEELETEINKLLDVNSQLNAEKKELESKIAALENQLEGTAPTSPVSPASDLNQLQEENSKLKNEIETLNVQINHFKTQITHLENYKTKSKSLEQELSKFKEEREKTQAEIDGLNTQLDQAVEINRQQSQRIENLEATLASTVPVSPPSPAPPTPSTTPSPPPKPAAVSPLSPKPATKAPTSPSPAPAAPAAQRAAPLAHATPSADITKRQLFGFSNGNFITAEKPKGIILEYNPSERLWILTIEPGVSFLDKNKALRVARSLPSNGWRAPDGRDKIGIGFELKIIGEYS